MNAEVIKMSSQDKDRNVALESAIGQIEKAFGKGSVMKLGTSGENLDVQAISKACSPASGCEISKSSILTPNFLAYTGSKACSASTNAHVPPAF